MKIKTRVIKGEITSFWGDDVNGHQIKLKSRRTKIVYSKPIEKIIKEGTKKRK